MHDGGRRVVSRAGSCSVRGCGSGVAGFMNCRSEVALLTWNVLNGAGRGGDRDESLTVSVACSAFYAIAGWEKCVEA